MVNFCRSHTDHISDIYCTKHLLQAEEVNINNKVYHKKCLTCGNCKGNLDMSGLAVGPDDDIYCKVCYLRYWGPGT